MGAHPVSFTVQSDHAAFLGRCTGAGSTPAGLTCAAVRDSSSRGWQLDPGVLVLADRGVCCLDDLNLMRKDAQASVLEAMEQQSISVAKVRYTADLLGALLFAGRT